MNMSRSTGVASEAARIVGPLAILAAGVGGFLVFGQKPSPATNQETGNRAPLVETAPVEAFDDKIVLDLDGVAEPFRRITLAAEVDGRIVAQSDQCRGGMFVAEGAELVRIDPTDYDLDVRRLETQLRHAKEELASVDVDEKNTRELVALAEENLKLWGKELARNEALTTSSAVTQATLDEVRRQELTGRNSLQTHTNQLAALAKRKTVLEAARDMIAVDLEQAQEVLRRTRIASPVEGTVITSHVEPGDYVRKGDPIVEISQTAPMEVRCNLRIEDLYWVWLAGGQVDGGGGTGGAIEDLASEYGTGTDRPDRSQSRFQWEIPQLPVEVAYRFNGSEAVWKGLLFRYEGTGLDAETRTVPCRVLVEEPLQASVSTAAGKQLPQARLVSGMYVQIRIPIDPPQSLLALPQTAVRPRNQVWIARDGVLRIETVNVAKVGREQVLVEAGATSLRPGDEVITSPLAAVKDGMPVRTASETSSES